MEVNLSTNLTDMQTQTPFGDFRNANYWVEPIYPLIPTYYPSYTYIWDNKSRVETSFKVIQKLMELKIIQIKTVKDFIETVNNISEVL